MRTNPRYNLKDQESRSSSRSRGKTQQTLSHGQSAIETLPLDQIILDEGNRQDNNGFEDDSLDRHPPHVQAQDRRVASYLREMERLKGNAAVQEEEEVKLDHVMARAKQLNYGISDDTPEEWLGCQDNFQRDDRAMMTNEKVKKKNGTNPLLHSSVHDYNHHNQ